jgi:hypothetical protein
MNLAQNSVARIFHEPCAMLLAGLKNRSSMVLLKTDWFSIQGSIFKICEKKTEPAY